MVWCIGDDGIQGEIPRDQLCRLWGWNGSQLRTKLAMREAQDEIIELWRTDGWHVWSTEPVITKA